MNVSTRTEHSRKPLLAAALLGLLFALSPLAASAHAGFIQKVLSDEDGRHAYQVFVPDNYTSRKQWPVVLFLHGAGERGTDGARPTTVGLGPMIRRHPQRFPFIAVFPQAGKLDGRVLRGWNADGADGRRALKILHAVEAQYSVDSNHRVLCGWSMGGHGVWSLAAAKPKLFSAVVSLSGGGDPALAKKLAGVRAWAFHGEHDPLVPAESTRKMVEAIRKSGGNARFTLVKGIGHSSWKAVFDYAPLLNWMRNPSMRIDAPEAIVATDDQKRIRSDEHLVPFVPAVEVSGAVTARIGTNALEAVSYSVPEMIPREMLSGELGDILDSTVARGRRFDVRFSGIGYTAQLARVRLQGAGEDRLRVQFGLRNVTMSIGRTYVRGRSRSAVAGPMYVVIGHRRPVWLTIDVQPNVADREFTLRTLATSFNIPHDNWYVTAPRGVSTEGLGMTRERVSSGLVSGLYGSKRRIEREVLSLVPMIVRGMERQLKIPDVSHVVDRVWPLPFYAPRVRLYPESIRTDKNGVTVSLGMTAAAIYPDRALAQPRRVNLRQNVGEELRSGSDLHVGIAQDVFAPLTQLMIDAGVARIDVRDIPEPTFARFADRKTMLEIIPDLKRLGPRVTLRSELILREPIAIDSKGTPAEQAVGRTSKSVEANSRTDLEVRPTLRIPRAVLAFAIQRPKKSKSNTSEWTPYAEFSLDLSQPLDLRLRQHGFTGRSVEIDSSTKPELKVDARFASNANPSNPELHGDRVREIVLAGWNSLLQRDLVGRTRIPDVDFGSSALRISKVGASNARLTATFTNPGTRITNNSRQSLQYEVKGPSTTWGGPYTLPAGESHTFDVPYDMIYRRRMASGYVRYTLPAGFHAEYGTSAEGDTPRLLQAE